MNRCKLLLAAGTIALWVGFAQTAWAASGDTNGKIASRVMSETSNGGSTEALVVLTRQADLSPAYNLPTKALKGAFVVSTLRATAQATQGPVIAMLRARCAIPVFLYR